MNIIVFGAGGFVAREFTRLARTNGHRVLTSSSRADQGADLVVDCTDESAINRLVIPGDEPIDGVLFGQGRNPGVGLAEANFAHFNAMHQINIAGPTLLVRKLMPRMQRGGGFVFIGTSGVRRGSFDPAYGANKAALWGLINSLARYNQAQRFNVISLALVEGSPVSESMPADRRKTHADTMFGGKLVDAEGVARVALELMSNQNINRTNFQIDGGMVT